MEGTYERMCRRFLKEEKRWERRGHPFLSLDWFSQSGTHPTTSVRPGHNPITNLLPVRLLAGTMDFVRILVLERDFDTLTTPVLRYQSVVVLAPLPVPH